MLVQSLKAHGLNLTDLNWSGPRLKTFLFCKSFLNLKKWKRYLFCTGWTDWWLDIARNTTISPRVSFRHTNYKYHNIATQLDLISILTCLYSSYAVPFPQNELTSSPIKFDTCKLCYMIHLWAFFEIIAVFRLSLSWLQVTVVRIIYFCMLSLLTLSLLSFHRSSLVILLVSLCDDDSCV